MVLIRPSLPGRACFAGKTAKARVEPFARARILNAGVKGTGVCIMNRAQIERNQVWILLAAIGCGVLFGWAVPGAGPALEVMLWPVLASLLLVTFFQVPVSGIRRALGDRRFLAAALFGNFVLMPLVAWALVGLLPDEPALRVGVLLVLLVPCTDWFITFTRLGRGSTSQAIAITPVNLLVQLAMLPLWLWIILGAEQVAAVPLSGFVPALAVIVFPLGAVVLAERGLSEGRLGRLRKTMAPWPVPLLGLVVALVAAAHAAMLTGPVRWLIVLAVPVFAAYLLVAALIGRLLARGAGLPVTSARTLVYGLASRNSFVVLPLALALPAGWEVAALVIIVQSVVELVGLSLLAWWVPRRLLPRLASS